MPTATYFSKTTSFTPSFESVSPESPLTKIIPSTPFFSPYREAPLSLQIVEKKEEKKEEKIHEIIDSICPLAKICFSSPVGNVRIAEDELYGLYVEIEVFGDTHQTLKEWLKLIDLLQILGINVPVYPDIQGKLDTPPGEFGRLVGTGLAKMKVGLRLEKPMDITEIISQEREE